MTLPAEDGAVPSASRVRVMISILTSPRRSRSLDHWSGPSGAFSIPFCLQRFKATPPVERIYQLLNGVSGALASDVNSCVDSSPQGARPYNDVEPDGRRSHLRWNFVGISNKRIPRSMRKYEYKDRSLRDPYG